MYRLPTLSALSALVALCLAAAGTLTPQGAWANGCRQPLSPLIDNGCVVTPGVLWRGARPAEAGIEALLDQGVATVVNLQTLHDDLDAFEAARPARADRPVVRYFRVREWEPNVVIARRALDDSVARFLAIMWSQPRPVYVHCRAGENRTGVMVGAWRILGEGMAVDQAVAEMQAYDGLWSRQDARYLRSLNGPRAEALRQRARSLQWSMAPEAVLVCGPEGCRPVHRR